MSKEKMITQVLKKQDFNLKLLPTVKEESLLLRKMLGLIITSLINQMLYRVSQELAIHKEVPKNIFNVVLSNTWISLNLRILQFNLGLKDLVEYFNLIVSNQIKLKRSFSVKTLHSMQLVSRSSEKFYKLNQVSPHKMLLIYQGS